VGTRRGRSERLFQPQLIAYRNTREPYPNRELGVVAPGITHDLGDAVSAALVEVQRREVVVRCREHDAWRAGAPRHQLGLRQEVPAHARSLPHRIGRERDDLQGIITPLPGECARNFALHVSHDG